jgi:hypothetical protein
MTEPIPPFDLYRELEVDASATTATIDAAWRSLAKRHHPDVAAGPDPDRITRLNLAHEWLVDDERRRRYDEDRLRKEGDWRRHEGHDERPESPGSAGVGRDGSFSERWYGTPQAGHTDPAARAEVAAARQRVAAAERRRSVLGIAGAAIVAVVVLGVAGSFLLRPAAAPSLPPPVTPNPTIDTRGQQELIDKLVATVTAKDAAWHVTAQVDLRLDGARGAIAFDAQVAGADSAGHLGGSLVAGDRDWVVKGSKRYLRLAGGAWKLEPRLAVNRGWDPFATLDDSVRSSFLRWEQKGGDRLGLVRLDGLLVLDPRLYIDGTYTITEVTGAELVLDVDESGRPVRGTAQATVTAKDAAGAAHTFAIRVEYTFAAVGLPASTAAPKLG